jgi:hypothetical protein
MSHNGIGFLVFGSVLLVIAVGLTWFGFTTNNPSPVPALSALALAIVSFIIAIVLISKGVRGVEPVESPPVLRGFGTVVLIIGAATTVYAAIAFFLIASLPPNNTETRLPSLYLLFAGMLVLFTGIVVRNFRLR